MRYCSQYSSKWETILEILSRLFMLADIFLTSNHADDGALLTDCCNQRFFTKTMEPMRQNNEL
jgi:hypothetical protein